MYIITAIVQSNYMCVYIYIYILGWNNLKQMEIKAYNKNEIFIYLFCYEVE